MKRSDLRGVVFDLDGTLCHYEIGIAEALSACLVQAGESPQTLGPLQQAGARFDRLWRDHESQHESANMICRHAFQTLLREHGSSSDTLAAKLSTIYAEIRLASVALYPGTAESLAALRPGYRLGLLTNGPSDLQWRKIRRLSIESLFDRIVVADDVGRYKPDVRIFRWTAKQLGLSCKEIVFVGDSPSADIAGARAAGLYCAWIHRASATRIPEIVADVVVTDLRELRKVLL
ncbi:HAD family hydrolase [Candidatus Bipolaricaulota bacterium]|nr:HAD family hydrolase [Candidatus Bipolaricaulota bacterium]